MLCSIDFFLVHLHAVTTPLFAQSLTTNYLLTPQMLGINLVAPKPLARLTSVAFLSDTPSAAVTCRHSSLRAESMCTRGYLRVREHV